MQWNHDTKIRRVPYSQFLPNPVITDFTGYNGFFEHLPVIVIFDDEFGGVEIRIESQRELRSNEDIKMIHKPCF